MRIRKNANLSSLMFSHASGSEALQTHVCQLNQSPWDVISFSQEACPSSLHLQFEGQDSFTGNGSLGDSIGAVESVASMMADAEERAAIKMKMDNMIVDDNYEMKVIPDKKRMLDEYYSQRKVLKNCGKAQCCNKCDCKGRHCKSETKQVSSMCDRHLSLLTPAAAAAAACLGPASSHSIKKPATGMRRSQTKSAKKGPYEFYYYSGFGPLWGKRRGGDRGDGIKGENNDTQNNGSSSSGVIAAAHNTTPSCTPSPSIDGFHYVDDDADEEEKEKEDNDNSDGGKKRMRKPVKARCLSEINCITYCGPRIRLPL